MSKLNHFTIENNLLIIYKGRQRRTTVSEFPQHENTHHRDLDIEDSNEFFKNYDNFLNVR